MNIILIILAATIVLGFLVFIHEGGHFLAARAFGVRVSEFMLGLPGPSVGIQRGATRFGVTAVPLGGYARVCGMEPGEMAPHLQEVLACVYRQGAASPATVASLCAISEDEAFEAMEELVEWGSIVAPKKNDAEGIYSAAAFNPTARQRRAAAKRGEDLGPSYEVGQPRIVLDAADFFNQEFKQQYRSLPAWKRMVILLAGPGVNLLFAIAAFLCIYCIFGIDVQNAAGEVNHITLNPIEGLSATFNYIGMVVAAVAALFNPQTAADTMSQSSSIVGIAVMSKSAFDAGFVSAFTFTAMLSVSLGVMNLLPIPPLDGGRLVIEIYQRIRRRSMSVKALNALSLAGMALFGLFFIVMMNQDIQRFILGNWS